MADGSYSRDEIKGIIEDAVESCESSNIYDLQASLFDAFGIDEPEIPWEWRNYKIMMSD